MTTYTPQQKRIWKEQQRAAQRDLLDSAIANVFTNTNWVNWVKFGRRNLRKYSYHNALLIFHQKPEATLVRGKKQWLTERVHLVDDAKAINIFAPIFGPAYDDNGRPLLDNNGKAIKKLKFFKTVQVYDVTDTNAPLVDIEQPLVMIEGDELGVHLRRLESFALAQDYLVRYQEVEGQGYVDHENSQILVNQYASPNAKVHTLVRELARIWMDGKDEMPESHIKVVAESAAVMTLGILGFDIRDEAVPYIAEWSNGSTETLDKFAGLVDELVKTLTFAMGV